MRVKTDCNSTIDFNIQGHMIELKFDSETRNIKTTFLMPLRVLMDIVNNKNRISHVTNSGALIVEFQEETNNFSVCIFIGGQPNFITLSHAQFNAIEEITKLGIYLDKLNE